MEELKVAKKLCQEIESFGYDAFLVGGVVRDLLLDLNPNDTDLCTNMPMEELEENFKTYNMGKSKERGGVITIVEDGFHFETANFRKDGHHSDGRHPDSIEFAKTIKEDVARRDFTINALAMKADGTVVDYVNGQEDLKNKILRTVGNPNERFQEDYLRILRLARFTAKLDFKIDKQTKFSAKKLAKNVSKLSKERISDELKKAARMGGKKFARYVELLDELKVLQVILPEVSALKFKPETPKNHPEGSTTFKHTLKALEYCEGSDLEVLATLFHDLGKAVTYELGKCSGQHTYYGHDNAGVSIVQELGLRLKFSTKEIELFSFCAKNHMRFHKIPEMKKSKVIKLAQHENFSELGTVCKADSLNRRGCDLPLLKAEQVMVNHKETKVCSLVSGNEIMELLNLKPGKEVGRIKNLVTEYVLDNDVTDLEEVTKLILKFGKEK